MKLQARPLSLMFWLRELPWVSSPVRCWSTDACATSPSNAKPATFRCAHIPLRRYPSDVVLQQADLHLATSTVREALQFSAILRQHKSIPKAEKLAYVDEVLALMDMESYADAIVGILGEGLNVEQRKRLTIGVELVAKPELLLFLDEPTSGLDSQTAWSICTLLRKLANHGQAILCV